MCLEGKYRSSAVDNAKRAQKELHAKHLTAEKEGKKGEKRKVEECKIDVRLEERKDGERSRWRAGGAVTWVQVAGEVEKV